MSDGLLHRLPGSSGLDHLPTAGDEIRHGEDLRCRVTGATCGDLASCRQWGCQAAADSLARGLQGVSAALELIGLPHKGEQLTHAD